jgi:outer membrane murein-binding lipoprotein Lpp
VGTRTAALVGALLLGGCASAQWTSEKGDAASQQVISECTFQASARQSVEALAGGTYVSTQSNAGAMTGRTEFPRNQVPPSSTGIQEQAFFNLCMRQKGYELVPEAKP